MKRNKGFKRVAGLFLAMVIVVASTGMVLANANSFTDITGHWAEDRIISWTEMGIVMGYGNTFKPDSYITRAEFMSLMNKTFFEDITDEDAGEENIILADVADDAWYAKTVKKAVVAGYISGYGEGIMKPEANITREEVAAIFSKVFELEQDEEVEKVFTDIHTISTWAKGYVGAVAAAGFMPGYEEGSERTFKGNQNITRAEAVVALDNVVTVIVEDISGGIFDDIFDEDFDFESMIADLSEEEQLALLQDIFGDFLGEDFFNNYENFTEEELEEYLQPAFEDLEARLSTMTEDEIIELLEKIFGYFEDMPEDLSDEEIEAMTPGQEIELEGLQ